MSFLTKYVLLAFKRKGNSLVPHAMSVWIHPNNAESKNVDRDCRGYGCFWMQAQMCVSMS
jgi:hypothetical protein